MDSLTLIFRACHNTNLHKIEGLDLLLGDLCEVEPRHVGAVAAEDVVEVESLSVGVAQRGVGQVVVQQVAGQTSDKGGVLLVKFPQIWGKSLELK